MSGFVRRYGSYPSKEQITAIEGIVIIDTPPPGSIEGVQSGVACVVGEFADMTYAVSISATGVVSTAPVPVEVFSAQDMANKVGGWDETLGVFGAEQGSGFLSLRNKKFSRLVIVPVNLTSDKGVRLWRDLPTNAAASAASPIVPVQAALVPAGREFKSSTNRARSCKRVVFTDGAAYVSVIDATTVVSGSAVTQIITSATAGFVAAGAKAGDLVVLGVIAGATYLGGNAGTYRIVSVDSATQLTVEKMDGTSFVWLANTASPQPLRLHPAAAGDTGGANILSATAGYLIPARPLDATISAATALTPSVVPAAGTATSWDPLSGLTMRTQTGGALTYTAAVQAPNAVNAAAIDALYASAVDALLTDDAPAREVNILWSARKSSTIRTKLKSHVLAASAVGIGRSCVLSPSLVTATTDAVVASTDPGVGGNRDERDDYAWPGLRHFVPEAVGFSLATSDAKTTTDGILDESGDGWLACLMSNLPPERNPGQVQSPVPELMAPVVGFQRGAPALTMNDYIRLKAAGVAGFRRDQSFGFFVQSGITTSLTSGQKNINRRRMADFVEDSVARALLPFNKLPLTNQLKDGAVSEVNAFLEGLLSPNNPAAQRINSYIVDPKSGNTPDLEAAGIFVIIVKVRTLATADFIVLQFEVGEGVNTSG